MLPYEMADYALGDDDPKTVLEPVEPAIDSTLDGWKERVGMPLNEPVAAVVCGGTTPCTTLAIAWVSCSGIFSVGPLLEDFGSVVSAKQTRTMRLWLQGEVHYGSFIQSHVLAPQRMAVW